MLSLFSSLTSHVECFHIARLVATDDEGETVFQPALIDDKLFDFLRAIHVFPATTKSFTQHETMNFLGQYLNENAVAGHQSGVDVMAYFGKQAAVQDQLTSAGWWPNKEIAPGLSSEAEGVYCLSFAHNGTTRVVVFAWLGDASFIAGLVRPTYVLRVLTRLASSVVFCLTDDDIAQAKTVTRELAAPLSSKKLSVSLSVHTAPVEENKIQCTINYEAGWGDQFEGGVLIAGPVVSIAVVTCTATDSTTYTTKSFESALEFAVWLDEIMDTKAVELQCGLPTAYMASAMQYRKEFPVNVMNWSSSDTMEQAASQAAERYVMDQVAELKERCEENTEVVFYQKIASADQEKAAFEALQKDLDEVRGWYARANKDPRSKIFDFRSSIDECVNAHYFRLVKQEKAKEAGAFGKFQYWFSSPDAVSFPYLAQSDLVKKAVEDAKSELSDLRQRWSQNLQHVLLHKKVLAALVVEARAALMQRALKLQKDEAIRKEFAAMIDRNNSLRSSLDKVILSSFNERTSNLSIAHLKIESTSNMLTLYECEKKLPTFQGHVTLPPTAEVIFITRGNKICIVVYRLENDEVTHVAAYKHYKTSKCLLDRVVPSAVVLCSFDPTSRVLALLHSKCLVGIYVFNKSYKSLDRIDGVNLMLLRLDPPYNHIVVFGGSTLGLTVMDHAGRIQSYFVQTKKISTLIDDASIANGDTKMISWHTGSMVVLLTPRTVRHDYYDVDVQIIDSTDNAMQPKTRLVLPKAIDWCRCSIQWTGETLVCFDPDSTRVRIWTLRLATSKAICQMEGIETEATEPSPLEIHPLRSLYHLFKTGTWSDLIAPTKLLSGPLHFQIRGEKHGQDVVKAVLSILMKDLQVENKGLISMNLEKVCTILEDEPPMWSGSTVSVSLWIFELVNLVPVQICRIRNNRLILVTNGRDEIELKAGFDVHEVARSIDFGFISALLHHWSGRVVVVSSMGKHKNDENIRYVLGNVFAAKRDDDMDGVWLAVKIVGSQLLVALDFEASCERSAQEQIFLSFLNAAISCLSIIQIDSSCGKDVDSVFTAFQRGVSLMKEDSRFFRGKLYLHATDSYSNEQEAVISTIRDKLSVILHESHAANFVSAMYGGHVDITCAAPLGHFDHVDPLDDGSELAAVHHTQPYDSGTKFHDSLAVVLSKLCLMDWTNIQGPLMIPFTRNELHDQIRMAILCGKVSHGSLDQGDLAAHVSEWITPFADSTLWKELPDDESLEFALNLDVETLRSLPDAKAIMLSFFKLYLDFIQIPRNASTEKEFDRVWNGLVLRRELLVRQWLAKLPSVGRNEIDDMDTCLLKLKQLLRRCQHSCDQCNLGCFESFAHNQNVPHDCGTNHNCTGSCAYCTRPIVCSFQAGHAGKCNCSKFGHTCLGLCGLPEAFNCEKVCRLEVDHDGAHSCGIRLHLCGQPCVAVGCRGVCTMPYEGSHTHHQCNEQTCQQKCVAPGCDRTCGEKDHFHPTGAPHLCGQPHRCPVECTKEGVCELTVQVESCENERLVSQMIGSKRKCSKMLAANAISHSGPHECETATHYCAEQCPYCQYFCDQPCGHEGLHRTAHGNLKEVCFVYDDRKVHFDTTNERRVAEMCPLVCSDVGRGHVHFQPCAQRASNCLATDGRKHYQQSFSTSSSLDEVLHETYWALQGWEDPVTSAAEKELFKLCSYKCHSIEHDVKAPSYCTLEAWHQPMVKSDLRAAQANWSVVEGHLLSCQHSAPRGLAHHVFVLAISGGSLGPTRLAVTNAVQAYLQEQMARKGGFECGDVVSVVISAAHGVILSEAEPIAAVVKADLSVKDFGSDLDVGLRCAIELLSRSRLHSDYSPTLVFFSDGSAGKDGVGLADHLVANYALYNLLCYVVAFSNADQESLKQLNRHLHGVYWPVVSEIDLKNAFKSISAREYARTG